MIWVQFAATALVIVFAGVRLARYGDVLGEKSGLGRSWVGVVLLAATTSLPELFTENWALGPTCNDSSGALTEPMPTLPPLVTNITGRP